MKNCLTFILTFLFLCTGITLSNADTLDQITKRGMLNCGVDAEKIGFASRNEQGEWFGFDVDICRAVAAAILRSSSEVNFKPVTAQSRFPVLRSGDIDMLTRSTTWTLTRDTAFGINFVGPIFYDGQAIMVLKELNIERVTDLNGAKVCLPSNTTAPKNAAEFFLKHQVDFQPVFVNSTDYGYMDTYIQGYCDAVINDLTAIAADRLARAKDPSIYSILPIRISKEPLSVAVRHGDDRWQNIVKLVFNALVLAEEYGITSQNIEEMRKSKNEKIQIFLGIKKGIGSRVSIDDEWAYRVIKQVGNYKEIYSRNIVDILGINRGLNDLWNNGGLLFSLKP